MVNSGKCSSLRSRSRNTRASSKILLSPAASNFLQENSGEVRKYRVTRSPLSPNNSVRGACRWVSLPGETCKMAVSTSTKPWSSNHARTARVIAVRAARNGLISTRRAGIHPGKGTPVSQIEMRRISDGVKISERYKTTDQVEKATIEERNFNYLYQDADGFHFMNNETYDQVQVPKEIVGSSAPYLQENMTVKLSMHDANPVAIQLPQRATLEVVETEPVTKGQTASSSYKPAVLSNGVRTAVPPHISAGTRIVVITADGYYVERAKD